MLFHTTSLFSQTPEDNAVINQMWYQRNIDILSSPVKYLYEDGALGDIPGADLTVSHLLHEIGDYSFVITKDSDILHILEFGLEWAFNEHFSVLASGKTVLSEYEKNKSWYFLGGFGFALNNWFSGKIFGGHLNANSPVGVEDNYSSFKMSNIGIALNLFNILSTQGQYEYYTIDLDDKTVSTGSSIYFKKVDASGLNYLSVGFDFLKLIGVPLTSSIEYFRFSDIKQFNIGTSLASIINSDMTHYFDIITDFRFIGKDWNMFENTDVSITLFIADFLFNGKLRELSARPLKNGQKIFSRWGFSISASYRKDNKDLPGNKISGFGGELGYGPIWYTMNKRQRITSIYNQAYIRLFYEYSPETYNAPNYKYGLRLGYRL
jgi:hypothetical protein